MENSLNNLPEDFTRTGFIANLKPILNDSELTIMNKIGGSKPFLYKDESWPIDADGNYLTFVCQYEHPVEKKVVRFFLNYKNLEEYKFDIIDLKKEHQSEFKINSGMNILPCHQIISWEPINELVDINTIYSHYLSNMSDFEKHFAAQLSNSYGYSKIVGEKFNKVIIWDLLFQEYISSSKVYKSTSLKVGGVTNSINGNEKEYEEIGSIMQLSDTKEIKFPFKIGHILADDLNFVYEID